MVPMTAVTGFRHEARFYAGPEGFLAETLPFVRDALDADAAILVVVAAEKVGWLRDGLGRDASEVRFADMRAVGRNPARIIPAWAGFVDEMGTSGRALRGIGEPFGIERRASELEECHRHESLLNVAFGGGRPWWLLCPYDVDDLPAHVVERARRTHPHVGEHPSSDFDQHRAAWPFADPLPGRPTGATPVVFDATNLRVVRRTVAAAARAAGLDTHRVADLTLAAHELATNSIRHGGGAGTVGTWIDDGAFVVEVCDGGSIDEALLGRQRPPTEQLGGRGVWLCNQLCDLVQIHSCGEGTAIRLHMAAVSA